MSRTIGKFVPGLPQTQTNFPIGTLASVGHLLGLQTGLIWTLIVVAALGIWSVVHRVQPGDQALDRLNWRQLSFVLIGASLLGIVLRLWILGPASFLWTLF